MKKFKTHIIAIVIVTIWAVFAYAYLGVEDGSSGLSILGKISAVFFIPGGLLIQKIGGNFSNNEIPFAAITSWFIFSLIALAIAQIKTMIIKPKNGE